MRYCDDATWMKLIEKEAQQELEAIMREITEQCEKEVAEKEMLWKQGLEQIDKKWRCRYVAVFTICIVCMLAICFLKATL